MLTVVSKNYFIPDIKEKIKIKTIHIDKSIRDFIHVSEVSKILNLLLTRILMKQ